jgi:hydrogenase maturation protease
MRHVVCFGNPLHGDDGFGPAVCARLAAAPLPADVRVFEAGTRGLDALALLTGCREAILVDAQAGRRPGRLRLFAPEALAGQAQAATGHGEGIGYLLRALAALGEPGPTLRILVAEADELRPFSPGLSPKLAAAADRAARLLCRCLHRARGCADE